MLPLLPHARYAADAAEQRGSEHAVTLLNNLGSHFDTIADYSTARALFERALRIKEQKLGTNHPSTQLTRNNLSVLLARMDADANGETNDA